MNCGVLGGICASQLSLSINDMSPPTARHRPARNRFPNQVGVVTQNSISTQIPPECTRDGQAYRTPPGRASSSPPPLIPPPSYTPPARATPRNRTEQAPTARRTQSRSFCILTCQTNEQTGCRYPSHRHCAMRRSHICRSTRELLKRSRSVSHGRGSHWTGRARVCRRNQTGVLGPQSGGVGVVAGVM